MTLTSVGEAEDAKGKSISEIGSMLFTRGVSGTRVVTGRDTKVIEGYTFKGTQHTNSRRAQSIFKLSKERKSNNLLSAV